MVYIPNSCICFPIQTLCKKKNRSESYAFKHCYHIPRKNVPIIMISATLCWVLKALDKCDFLTIFLKIYLFLLFQVVKLNIVQHFPSHKLWRNHSQPKHTCRAVTISCLHTVTSKSLTKTTIQAKTFYRKPLVKLAAYDPVLQGQC